MSAAPPVLPDAAAGASAARPVLSVTALAVATEEDPRYGDARGSQGGDDGTGLFGGWDAPGQEAGGGLLTAYLTSVAEHSGLPLGRLRMLTAPADGTGLAEKALLRLGPPPVPQPFALVQAAADRDTLSAELPRLMQELEWPFTEDMGLTHLGDRGGATVVDLVSWWADPATGATVVVADQPLFALAGRLPRRLTAVALRFGGGEGPLHVLDWGEDRPAPAADHVYTGPGACGGWPALCDALDGDALDGLARDSDARDSDEPRPGDRILVRCGAGEHHAWVLLRRTAAPFGRRS
ncbi:hypothetical protein [Streptomyces griseosporeus]|uniref:hypothetical protein n=1 Tax=Streptomyces griseosporeus TaxID=1910 RepID=UPI0036F629D8